MKVNVFEGARRVAKLFGGLLLVGCLAFGALNEPYFSVQYRVLEVGKLRELSTVCDDVDAIEYKTMRTPAGFDVPVRFCFPAVIFDTGESMIPYSTAGGDEWQVDEKHSTKVQEFTRTYATKYRFDDEGLRAVSDAKKQAYLTQWKEAGLFALGGSALLWGFTWATGWIVRGFLGIPRGRDSK